MIEQLVSFRKRASKTPVSELDLYLWTTAEGDISEGVKKLSLKSSESKKKEVVWVSLDETIGHTIKILTGHKMYIPASPVLDDKQKCQRLLNLEDLISFVMKQLPDPSLIASHEHELLSKIYQMRIGDVLGEITSSSFEFLRDDMSVLDALERFSRCIHQVALVQKDGHCAGICSQMDLLAWLQPMLEKEGELEDLGSRTIENLHDTEYITLTGREGVRSCLASESVLGALMKISKEHVHGLAVVNEQDRLVANFSATDIRGMVEKDNFGCLLGRVDEYLAQVSPESLKPFCIRKETTLREVIEEFIASQIHHAFVVQSEFIPIGVLSLSDLCMILAPSQSQSGAHERESQKTQGWGQEAQGQEPQGVQGQEVQGKEAQGQEAQGWGQEAQGRESQGQAEENRDEAQKREGKESQSGESREGVHQPMSRKREELQHKSKKAPTRGSKRVEKAE